MTTPGLLRRRTTTPVRLLTGGTSNTSLPGDLLLETCRRVRALGVVAAGLWSFSILVNAVLAPLLGGPPIIAEVWPWPALHIALFGLVLAIGFTVMAGRMAAHPERLLDASAGLLLVNSFLAALLTQWIPPPITPRVSWLAVLVLIYPAIVPLSPRRTLVISLAAASMDPLALGIVALRGVTFDHSPFYYIWSFLPTYLCAVIAVVPAKVIRSLGQQVRRARELGSYRLEALLGRGGMGEVFRASHQMLARPAAVKMIRPEVIGEHAPDKARVILERFRREAEASATLRSPHTISLYDFGMAQDGTFFLVMELLEGLDLERLVERFGPLPPERAVHLLCQVCHSLEEAHRRGMIHRDIKPSNIFTCRMGLEVDFVKVLDFGLVKLPEDGGPEAAKLTAPNATAGTPAFIAPEVVHGEHSVDARVDIYALGCVAYWLLTGQLVFEARQPLQQLLRHLNEAPVPPSRRVELPIPGPLDDVVLACLAKDPAARPATAAELATRLQAALGPARWEAAQAAEWWERHHPEMVEVAEPEPPGRAVSKTLIVESAG